MKKIILACTAGILAIAFGGYFAFYSFKQKLVDASDCVQDQDIIKKIDGCTRVIDATEGKKYSLIKIQNPDLPSAYLERGYGYFKIEKYDEARQDFNKAIKLRPSLAMAYNNLGALDLGKGDLESADKNLDHAIDLDPKLSLAWNNRCSVRTRMEKYTEAAEACTHAILLDGRNIDNYVARGDSYFSLGDNLPLAQDDSTKQKYFKDALSDFDTAIKLAPSEARAYNERCRLLIAKTDYAGALTSCETAIKLSPDSAAPYTNRGLALLRQGNGPLAIADFDTAIRLDPKLRQPYGWRSESYRMTGDFDKALENSQAMLAQFPDDPVAFTDRAMNYFALGNFHAATEDFTAALNHDDSVYRKLWRYVSLMRAGEDGTSKLTQDTNGLKDKSWPYPVIEFYLGQRNSDAMMAAASNDDQRCEATFYLGEWNLLQRNTRDAAALLQKAVDTCPKTFVEYEFAQAELKRMAR